MIDHFDSGCSRSAEAEVEARALINDYMSRYRPKSRVNGLTSFTTMQTALNSLAGHYASYANRPLPEDLHDRIAKELKKAEPAWSAACTPFGCLNRPHLISLTAGHHI